MDRMLKVYANGLLVGSLYPSPANGDLTFDYDPNWTAGAISLSLPRRGEPLQDPAVENFFANLLPEGHVRDRLARQIGVSPDDTLRLLAAVGGDCAGALQILPEGEPYYNDTVEGDSDEHRRVLDEMELAELVQQLSTRPLFAGRFQQGEVRMSLAGAQDKLPVCYDGSRVAIPLDGSPSTHILKVPPPDLEALAFNELYCMRLAERVGLEVTSTEVLYAGRPVFLTARYDRHVDDGRVMRLHQEDFCQALGVSHKRKYQGHGGPGFAGCREVLLRTDIPARNIQAFLRLAIFNVLIGNYDAHAKNYSLLYPRGLVGAPRLAPAYDLVSIFAFGQRFDPTLAMLVGEQNMPGHLLATDWELFAQDLGVSSKLVRREIKKLATAIRANAPSLAGELGRALARPDVFERLRCSVVEHVELVIGNG